MNKNVDWTEFSFSLKLLMEAHDIGKYFDGKLNEVSVLLTGNLRHIIALLPQDMQKTN